MKKVIYLLISLLIIITACNNDDNISEWRGGKIPFYLTGDFSDDDREILYEAMEKWESVCDVHFIEVTKKPEAYEIIRKRKNNDWVSSIGESSNHNYMYFCDGPNKPGHVLHELGHCLGLMHEHQRPDRGKHIKILRENISDKHEYNFNIKDNPLIDEKNYKYDCNSIMHYRTNSFSNNGSKTISIKSGGCMHDHRMGQREYLSPIDIKKIQSIYGLPKNNSR